MAAQSGNSLTRKSNKDDVEALLSDFDKLDRQAHKPSSKQAAGVLPIPSPSSSSVNLTTSRKPGTASAQKDDAQSLLDDLDDLVKQRRAPTPKKASSGSLTNPSNTKSVPSNSDGRDTSPASADAPVPIPTDTLTVDGGASATLAAASSEPLSNVSTEQPTLSNPAASWGSWWSSATKLADNARAELEKRAAQVQSQVAETTAAAAAAAAAASAAATSASANRETSEGRSPDRVASGAAAVPWQLAQNVNSFLKSHGGDLNKIRADLGKVGMQRWTEILNVVVPPIESHEVLSITLSHDMLGFDGVPDVVFQILQRVMEAHASSQNAEQQLIVNKAPDRKSTSDSQHASEADHSEAKPDMRPVAGFQEAWKLAESRLEELVVANHVSTAQASSDAEPKERVTLPITTCPLYIRIQPVLDNLPGLPAATSKLAFPTVTADSATHLYLAILLRDPTNNLTHRTISQPLPKAYATLPFESNPWAEDLLSESLQGALGSVGLEYVRSRMQAQSEALSKAAEETPEKSESADVAH